MPAPVRLARVLRTRRTPRRRPWPALANHLRLTSPRRKLRTARGDGSSASDSDRRALKQSWQSTPREPWHGSFNKLAQVGNPDRKAAAVLAVAVRLYLFRKHAEAKRAKLFRPPSIAEALDHRDYHLPTIEGSGGLSRLLPLCSSIKMIRRHVSADLAMQLLLQRALVVLFLALTLLSYPQILGSICGSTPDQQLST